MATSDELAISRFHRLYYDSNVWQRTSWFGIPVYKCPLDLWIYQEILAETRPDLIIETGTAEGGSALFLASICDQLDSGRIISIDIAPSDGRPTHPRIRYITGSSVSRGIIHRMHREAAPCDRVMVVLDSDHKKEHVLGELAAYAPLVTPGQYLVVEDTNLNGNPVRQDFGEGPREALEEFLVDHDEFEPDAEREKLLVTFQPGGYLRRRLGPDDGSRLELQHALAAAQERAAEVEALRQTVSEQRTQLDVCARDLESLTNRSHELRRMLLEAHDHLTRRDVEFQSLSSELHAMRASRRWRWGESAAAIRRKLLGN